jgi:class 3 adenylate cyclase
MEAAQAGTVLVSGTVRDLIAGSGIRLEERQPQKLKGLQEEWRLHEVID